MFKDSDNIAWIDENSPTNSVADKLVPQFTPEFHKIRLACDACGEIGKLDRHHIGREYLFVSVLAKTKLARTKWYKEFKKRYYEFRPYDVRKLCRKCHKKVHKEYKLVLEAHNFMNYYKPIEEYTIKEVKEAVKLFREAYFEWRESQ